MLSPAVAGKKGRGPSKARVLSEEKTVEVRALASRNETRFARLCIRATERGTLQEEFALRRDWTTHNGEEPDEEWLVIRHEGGRKYTYALSNAPPEAPVEQLTRLKCQRYFIERANQDAKSEIGWDELRAQKYRAWEPHLALTGRC
jgi:SRSO17 transposase